MTTVNLDHPDDMGRAWLAEETPPFLGQNSAVFRGRRQKDLPVTHNHGHLPMDVVGLNDRNFWVTPRNVSESLTLAGRRPRTVLRPVVAARRQNLRAGLRRPSEGLLQLQLAWPMSRWALSPLFEPRCPERSQKPTFESRRFRRGRVFLVGVEMHATQRHYITHIYESIHI